jgi:hypothetical protein
MGAPILSGRETWLVDAAATTPPGAGAPARTDGRGTAVMLVRRRHVDLHRQSSALCRRRGR